MASEPPQNTGTTIEQDIELIWRFGARSSAAVVVCASKFISQIELVYNDERANAKSMMELVQLSLKYRLVMDKGKSTPARERLAQETLANLKKPGNHNEVDIQAGEWVKLVINGPDAAAALKELMKVFRDDTIYWLDEVLENARRKDKEGPIESGS